MWFKQVQLFELASPIAYQPEEVAEQLQNFTLIPCLPSLPFSVGWVSPFSREEAPLVMAADGYILICLGISEKILPSAVVSQMLTEQIREIEAKERRKVGQKQRQNLKDEVIQTLLPRAFVKSQALFACIDTRRQWLWLSTINARYAERFNLAWQKVFPNVALVKPELAKVSAILTHWVQHHSYPKQFSLEKNFMLQDVKQQSRIIRCQQQELSAASIQSLLKDGCEVRQLALSWQERVHFTLDEQLQLRNMRFTDEIVEQIKDPLQDSLDVQLATDFTLLTAHLTELYTDLLNCFTTQKTTVEHPQLSSVVV